MEEKVLKPWTRENAKDKAIRYCLYQERCTQEVLVKLLSHKVYDPLRLEIIDFLLEEKYVDDERYTNAIVRGKSNSLKWGESKIRNYLTTKLIPKSIIDKVIKEVIDPDQNLDQLISLIEKKLRSVKSKPDFAMKNKITKAMMGKGYNFETIKMAWSKIEKD